MDIKLKRTITLKSDQQFINRDGERVFMQVVRTDYSSRVGSIVAVLERSTVEFNTDIEDYEKAVREFARLLIEACDVAHSLPPLKPKQEVCN